MKMLWETVCKEKHSWKSLKNTLTFIFPHPLGINPLEAEEELIDYFGAHLKKLLSSQFACHINYKQTSPPPRNTNSLSTRVPTRLHSSSSNTSSCFHARFFSFSDVLILLILSSFFQSKERLSRVRFTSSTRRLESAPGMTPGCPGNSFPLLSPRFVSFNKSPACFYFFIPAQLSELTACVSNPNINPEAYSPNWQEQTGPDWTWTELISHLITQPHVQKQSYESSFSLRRGSANLTTPESGVEHFWTDVELDTPQACASAFNQTLSPALNSPLL